MLSNFPVAEFNNNKSNTPICGFRLGLDKTIPKLNQSGMSYISAHLDTMMNAHDEVMLKYLSDKVIVIDIDLSISRNVNVTKNLQVDTESLKTAQNDLQKLEQFRDALKTKSEQLPQDKLAQSYFDKHINSVTAPINELKQKIVELARSESTKLDCGTLDFNLTVQQKQELHNNGKAAAEQSLSRVKHMLANK
ncbi:MAG: hypothetical protein HRT38_18700 [Alteromonadaceae bacterium]|nr:hypothetical protein [Alteromonadaceae bacterium]